VNVIPHLLGAGIQLFATGLEHRLSLQAHREFPSGMTQLHYQVLAEDA
jgi:dihydrofolate reductase